MNFILDTFDTNLMAKSASWNSMGDMNFNPDSKATDCRWCCHLEHLLVDLARILLASVVDSF